MSEDILDGEMALSKPIKLYSLRSIVVVTFIVGPIATGILLRRNFKNLNEPQKARIALYLGILSMVLIIIVLVMLPESLVDSIPQVIIPLVYTLIA